MKRFLTAVVVVLCFAATETYSQNIAPTWTAIFQGNGDNSDRFHKIISDGAGNFIGVGYTVKPGNYRDILTVKFKPDGDTLWWRTKNGKASGDDEAVTVDIDASGNVYVGGTVDADERQNDMIVLKYDPNGVAIWDTTWDYAQASLDDEAVELKVDLNGDVILGGNSEPDTFAGSSNYAIIKLNSNGGLVWDTIYDGPKPHGKDELKAIDLDANGDVYVTGRAENTTDDDMVSIKFNGSTGDPIWTMPYNSGNNDRGADIAIDNAGNVIVTGQTFSSGNYNVRTNKYNNSGILQWTQSYASPAGGDDDPVAMAIDGSDNVVIVGEADVDVSSSGVNFDFQIIKYTSAGSLAWPPVRIGNTVNQNDVPSDVVLDASGNIYVTGKSDNSPNTTFVDNDYMTVSYTASGSLNWGPFYHAGTRPNDDDIASSIIIDGSDLYVAGGAVNTTTQKDATVIKYELATGNQTWVRDYNGTGDFSESAKKVVVDANNNSYAAGYTFNENKNLDATIRKINPAGVVDVNCFYTYNGLKNDDDEFVTMAIASNGMIYCAGYTKVTGQKRNLLLVKWDPSICDTAWTRTYDYIGQSDRAIAMVLDAPGNIYVTGRSDANPVDTSDNDDIITMKYDSNGNQVWLQRFNGSGNLKDEPAQIILDANGDVLVGGRSENVHDDEFVLIKYNAANGNPVWGSPAIYNSPFSNDDRITDLAIDGSNNIFVAGFSQTSSGANAIQDPVILKYDAAGNMGGFYSYTGDDQDEPVRIAVAQNNKVYVLFKFDADGGIPNQNNNNFYLQRFENDLTIDNSFSIQYDSPILQDDIPSDMIISSSGDIYITGSSENDTLAGRINKNWVTLGYDPSGVRIFLSNYDGPAATDDSPNSLIIYNNQLWVAGNTEGLNNNQKDLTVNNYNLLGVGVKELSNTVQSNAWPNPFSSTCTISIDAKEIKAGLALDLYDLLGNKIMSNVKFNNNQLTIQKGNLAPGIYEFRILSDSDQISHGKLIIN